MTRLWETRLAEQATWPETTETDRLLAAFETLNANGIVARANFMCCSTCGHTEIDVEAGDGARGYVFFQRASESWSTR